MVLMPEWNSKPRMVCPEFSRNAVEYSYWAHKTQYSSISSSALNTRFASLLMNPAKWISFTSLSKKNCQTLTLTVFHRRTISAAYCAEKKYFLLEYVQLLIYKHRIQNLFKLLHCDCCSIKVVHAFCIYGTYLLDPSASDCSLSLLFGGA